MPTIGEIVRQFQDALDAQLEPAMQRLLDSYQRSYKTLLAEQDALAADVARLRAEGQEPSKAQIRKMARYRQLVTETEREMTKYAAVIEDQVRADAPGAAYLGTQQAEALVQAQFQTLPVEAQAQIMATFQRMPVQAVEALVGALQEQSPLWALLQTFGAETAKGVADALLDNLLRGKNPRDVARLMANEWGIPLTRAMTIARTEQLRAHRAATMAEYRLNPHIVKGWQWHASLDTRVCGSCLAQHGSVHTMDETLDDHPNGRCAAVPITPSWEDLGFEGLPDTRLQLAEGDGERWFTEQPENVQREMMGPGKYEAWKAGSFDFAKLSKEVNDADWGRSFVEASLKDLLGEGSA